MDSVQRKAHWEQVYRDKSPDGVSWYQQRPETSLSLIRRAGLDPDAPIIDIGGGASTLVDCLVSAGYRKVSVLDISARALEHARGRLPAGAGVTWLAEDVTRFRPRERYRLWHDRAAFHFLTDPADQARYLDVLRQALEPGGQLILAAFAQDGPLRCSGLEVVRQDAQTLGQTLGPDFRLLEEVDEWHETPWGARQHFAWFRYSYHPCSRAEAGESAPLSNEELQ